MAVGKANKGHFLYKGTLFLFFVFFCLLLNLNILSSKKLILFNQNKETGRLGHPQVNAGPSHLFNIMLMEV